MALRKWHLFGHAFVSVEAMIIGDTFLSENSSVTHSLVEAMIIRAIIHATSHARDNRATRDDVVARRRAAHASPNPKTRARTWLTMNSSSSEGTSRRAVAADVDRSPSSQ